MKRTQFFDGLIVILVIYSIFSSGVFIYNSKFKQKEDFFSPGHGGKIAEDKHTEDLLSEYSNSFFGISFSYPSDYIITEHQVNNNHQITLINKKDLPLPVNGEAPPSVTINIYENDKDKYTAEDWALKSKESNLKLGEGTISNILLSKSPAISYRWSGLYEGTTIVSANPKYVYTLNVTYLEMGAPIVQDFVKIRDSVKIVKQSSSRFSGGDQ